MRERKLSFHHLSGRSQTQEQSSRAVKMSAAEASTMQTAPQS